MSGPVLALRAAMLAHLGSDPILAGLMGGAVRLDDEPPRGSPPVYALFGDVSLDDWSTDLDRGHVQQAEIMVWGRPGSAASALLAADRVAALLDDAALTLGGHRLVSLRVTGMRIGRDASSDLARVAVRLRAVTEVIPAAP